MDFKLTKTRYYGNTNIKVWFQYHTPSINLIDESKRTAAEKDNAQDIETNQPNNNQKENTDAK